MNNKYIIYWQLVSYQYGDNKPTTAASVDDILDTTLIIAVSIMNLCGHIDYSIG